MTDKEFITALRKACHDCNPTPCCEYEVLGHDAADRIEALQSKNTALKAKLDKAVEVVNKLGIIACERDLPVCNYCIRNGEDCHGDGFEFIGVEESK